MNLEAIRARLAELRARLLELGETPEPTEEQRAEFDTLDAEYRQLDEQREQAERREQRLAELRQVAAAPGVRHSGSAPDDMDRDPIGEPRSTDAIDAAVRRTGRNPWDLSGIRSMGASREQVGAELRSRAMDAIELMPGASQRTREAAARILERFDTPGGLLARQALATSSPIYLRAFAHAAMGQVAMCTEEERTALQRAMSLTDAAGGYLVPFQLDPTLILTGTGSVNPFRQISRTVVATGDTWNGVSSAAATWSYDAEASEASDDAPTVAGPAITIHKGVGFIPISEEALQDEANITQVIADVLAAGKDDLEAAAFATGSGSGQPVGIVTALAAASPSVTTASATTDTFAVADLFALESALPARYRQRASWVANWAIFNAVRQFGANGVSLFQPSLVEQQPERLLGHPKYESSAMDGVINAGATNRVAVIGDFSQYVIADRLGMTVSFIPHLFHTDNNRPSGQSGWRAIVRHGADSVNDGAFRMLDVT